MLHEEAKRLTTRIPLHTFERLNQAADITGATVNQFIVQAALEKAQKMVENESLIILSAKESKQLMALLENPPPRNAHFQKAMAHYQDTIASSD